MNIPGLSIRMAWRYLAAPKSHSAVSAIAAISVTGVAVATAAIVCVLSVFNGFQSLLTEKFNILTPDVIVTPKTGKVFLNGDSLAKELETVAGVRFAMPTVVDNALVIVDGREMPVTLRGVEPALWPEITSIDSIMIGGSLLSSMNADEVIASAGVASQMGIYSPGAPMLIFTPRRKGRVNLANPMSSFLTDSVTVSDVFQAMQSDYDENNVVCDISLARNLFQYGREATAIEIKVSPGCDYREVAVSLRRFLGESAEVKDRAQQQDVDFKMVMIEKWVTFLLLSFILVIAFFNIVSTLCMLVAEKKESIWILSALGMSRRRIAAVFGWESMMVSVGGGLAGIAVGVVLSLAQQHFGLVKIGGDSASMVLDSYPVVVELTDVLITLLPVAAIGLVTAVMAGGYARRCITRVA